MKRIARFTMLSILSAAVLSGLAFEAIPMEPLTAAGCDGPLVCAVQFGGHVQPPITVTGLGTSPVDCAWARMKARNNARAQVTCTHGTCRSSMVETSPPCDDADPAPYNVAVRLTFNCMFCNGPEFPCIPF